MNKLLCLLLLSLGPLGTVIPSTALADTGSLGLSGAGDLGQMSAIASEASDAKHQIASAGAAAIGRIVQENVRIQREIMILVQDPSNTELIAAKLEQMAISYRTIADTAPQITSLQKQQLRRFSRSGSQAKQELLKVENLLESLRQRKATLQRDSETIQGPVEKVRTGHELKALGTRIGALEARRAIWHQFWEGLEELDKKLGPSLEAVNTLLHVLALNADVYKDAAITARLKADMDGVIEGLTSASSPVAIQNQIVQQWREIDTLMDDLVALGFDT